MPILAPPSRPTSSPSPSASEDDVVLIDDDDGDSRVIVPQNTLPSGRGRRSLPSEGNSGSSTPRESGGAAVSLSRSSLDTEMKPQIGSGQCKSSNFSRSRKSNLSTSSNGSLSSSSISITKTRDHSLEPITLTVRNLNLTLSWVTLVSSPAVPQVNKVEAGGIMVQWMRNGASEFDTSKVWHWPPFILSLEPVWRVKLELRWLATFSKGLKGLPTGPRWYFLILLISLYMIWSVCTHRLETTSSRWHFQWPALLMVSKLEVPIISGVSIQLFSLLSNAESLGQLLNV